LTWARWVASPAEPKEARDNRRVQSRESQIGSRHECSSSVRAPSRPKVQSLLTLTISRRGDTMIRTGDIFKNIESGKMFTVKSINSNLIILATKDESHSMFVNPNNIESMFAPFVEDESKGKLK
jgi:hypothetical protein